MIAETDHPLRELHLLHVQIDLYFSGTNFHKFGMDFFLS